MTIDDLKKIRPIPGFDCVKMKHDIQAKIYEETKDMSWDERIAYFRRGSEEFRREMGQRRAMKDALVLHEDPPAYGEKKSEK